MINMQKVRGKKMKNTPLFFTTAFDFVAVVFSKLPLITKVLKKISNKCLPIKRRFAKSRNHKLRRSPDMYILRLGKKIIESFCLKIIYFIFLSTFQSILFFSYVTLYRIYSSYLLKNNAGYITL